MNVKFEEREPKRLACIRHIGPYNQIGAAFQQLSAWMRSSGIPQDQFGDMIAVYYDDPNVDPPEKLRGDAGIVVSEGIAIPEGATEERLAGGRYATYTHLGPYEGLGDAWAKFYGEWLPANGVKWLDAPCFEIYRNDCSKVAPEEVRTDLYIPVQ